MGRGHSIANVLGRWVPRGWRGQRAADGVSPAGGWERFGALDQIVPEKALIIGDFELGSDSPIILDYSRDASNPPVLRLWLGARQAHRMGAGRYETSTNSRRSSASRGRGRAGRGRLEAESARGRR